MSQSNSKQPGRKSYFAAIMVSTALTALPTAVQADSLDWISKYCQTCWRNAHVQPDLWQDCTQDVYCRLLERLKPTQWSRITKKGSEEHREFIRAIDAVKKRTKRSHRYASLVHDPRDERVTQNTRQYEGRQQLYHMIEQELSTRQQQIIKMSLDGYAVAEIAEEMELPANRVSDEKYKAIRKLQASIETI